MKRILLIDDNPRNNNIFITSLRKKYEVDVAMYLNGATRMMKHRQYDLIVLDVMMPLQHLKSSKEMETGFLYYEQDIKPLGRKTPVVFWSRLSENSFKNYFEGKSSDNLYFVHKDSDENQLLEKIKDIFK